MCMCAAIAITKQRALARAINSSGPHGGESGCSFLQCELPSTRQHIEKDVQTASLQSQQT